MIRDAHPVLQAFLGTLMTWGITALGASFVFVTKKRNRKLLDVCLGFAAGVMTAASFWSLLAPGIEMAEESGVYGVEGEYAFGPTAIGFIVGALFVAAADFGMTKLTPDPTTTTATTTENGSASCCRFFKGKLSDKPPSEVISIPPVIETEAVANEGYDPEKTAGDDEPNNNARLGAGRADSW